MRGAWAPAASGSSAPSTVQAESRSSRMPESNVSWSETDFPPEEETAPRRAVVLGVLIARVEQVADTRGEREATAADGPVRRGIDAGARRQRDARERDEVHVVPVTDEVRVHGDAAATRGVPDADGGRVGGPPQQAAAARVP